MINYVKGDATSPTIDGVKFLPHIVNTLGGWGKGYVLALSKKWKEPEKYYRHWHKNNENIVSGDKEFLLGNNQYVSLPNDFVVVNMIAQEGYSKPNSPAIRYEALTECFDKLSKEVLIHNGTVHMPRIGAGLACGKWDIIEQIILNTLVAKNISVTVYDLY